MNLFPRWRGLPHLPSPTTIDFSDAETFWTILKVSAVTSRMLPHVIDSFPVCSAVLGAIVARQLVPCSRGTYHADDPDNGQP
jgi:hypothetical protein